MSLEVHPATADRFDDVATLLRPRREDAPACWCLYYRLTSSEFNKLKGKERPQHMRDLCEREHSPGMLAYVDDTVVGWCALGPRTEMGRLQRSRTIPKLDDRPVWSIVCFVVRAGYRRKGVARALLNGAIDYARDCGVEALESYPVDTDGARINGSFAYVGTVGMFEAAGFERVLETASRRANLPRWLMRLELS
ncbi:GNAT family N-acetyltransferase [Kibdelosporangium persicum]|uniref:GNAT family N-acetyltransferase n=1 Tax=Kibdelosporangium persicum TaxID=2698649 RepID=UPI001564D282|nr:GNAT family N-acetyltransferase [Kibdelosporangium persicum]